MVLRSPSRDTERVQLEYCSSFVRIDTYRMKNKYIVKFEGCCFVQILNTRVQYTVHCVCLHNENYLLTQIEHTHTRTHRVATNKQNKADRHVCVAINTCRVRRARVSTVRAHSWPAPDRFLV